jgi:hypothetical protein
MAVVMDVLKVIQMVSTWDLQTVLKMVDQKVSRKALHKVDYLVGLMEA